MKLSDRQEQAVRKLRAIDPDSDFFWDEDYGAAKFVKGKLSKPSRDDPQKIAQDFLARNAALLDLQQGLNEALAVTAVETDSQGFSHVSFAQSLNGIPVFEGSTQVHVNGDGEVVAYKDYRLAALDVPLEPGIDAQLALQAVLQDLGIDSSAIAEYRTSLLIYRDANKLPHLAWQVEWLRQDDLAANLHIVDAHSGSILFKHTRQRSVASRLTYSANNSTELRASLLLTDEQTSSDAVANAAHEHAAQVYRYFLDTFGRDSYDGQGAELVSTVHFRQGYNNAFWTDWYRQMVYGDGDGVSFDPLALALDVVGHELSHAVSSRTARFVYAEEAGALDESFADFFGVMVSNEGEITDWKMGEGVYTPFRAGDALRDLSEPSKYGQPDHMNEFLALAPGEQPDSDKNDNGYVHSNSGIPNKAAFLTVSGGSHHGIEVAGIGRLKAEQVYYLAMTSYLSSSTDSRWTFMQARYALLNACRQLYGDGGSEYAAIKNAWAAVGVGEPASGFAVIRREISPYLAIPDNRAAGIESVLRVEDEAVLKDIVVGVVIEHSYIGDLRVRLTSPAGESVVLHDREGGSSNDLVESYELATHAALNSFFGDRVRGNWTLSVSDHARVDTGKLVYWELQLALARIEKRELTEQAIVNLSIPDNDPSGVESRIALAQAGKLVRLDVPVDITHTWIGDLRVLLTSPSGSELLLHDRSGRSRHDIRTVFSTTSFAAMQVLVGEEIQGDWRLRVIDTFSRDVGTLNSWGLHCVYE